MNTLNSTRLGLAFGLTLALLNFFCRLVVVALPRDWVTQFLNSFTHVDWTPLIRWNMPAGEWLVGVLEVFVAGWIAGALIGVIYNTCGRLSAACGKMPQKDESDLPAAAAKVVH